MGETKKLIVIAGIVLALFAAVMAVFTSGVWASVFDPGPEAARVYWRSRSA
jgi:hypothetical protein